MLMASMRIEVAASSLPFNHSFRDHNRSANIKGYIHSQFIRKIKAGDENEDSSWLPSMNSNNDDSWLPTTSQNSSLASESGAHSCRKGPNNVDDSWLPTINNTNGKNGTNANELENDIDYSWLPSTFVDHNKNKQKNIIDNDKNKQKNINEKNKIKNSNTNVNTNKNKNNNNITNNSNTNNNSNRNNSSNSNRNSNSNNSPQKKSRSDHWELAREFVFSYDPRNQKTEVKKSNSQRLQKQGSPSKPRYVVESPTSAGVSSLLQRWKNLAEVKNSNKNDNSSPSTIRNNFRSTCKEDNNSNSSNSPQTPSTTEDSNPDWESDKPTRRLSCPLPSRDSKDSNPGGPEKEKIRVVDIIKKLSREEQLAASHCGNESLPPIRTTLQHQQIEGEHKGFKSIRVSRHLIRGRQAFNNFLMQMEHDKNQELRWLVERRAVSKFSHRGRIQAMLRFKIMRLGAKLAEPKPEVRRHKPCDSKTLESNNRLDIMDLREKFNSGVEKGAIESRKYKICVIKKSPNEEIVPTTSTMKKEVEVMTKTKTTTTNEKQEPQQRPVEPMNPSRSTKNSPSSRKDVVHKAKFVDSSSSSIKRKEDTHYKEDKKYDFYEDEGHFESARTSYSQMEDRGIIDLEEMNDTNKKQPLEGFEDWMTSDYSQTRSELDEYRYLDEDESYDMQVLDTNYDWISDISRPKSDWEYLRQARYQEMSSGKGDIQRLLERKSVSGFLGSGLRDLLDQLIVSRVEQSSVHVEKHELVVREKGESSKEEVEQEDCSTIDEDGDCRSRAETKCSEYSEYVDQTPYSERSWRPNDNVYNSETATTTSPSLERSPLSNRSHINSTPQSASTNTHRTIEMELIYELRGHMEQLHHEIMDLRKSIKSCVNMQVKMQHSFKQHVVANTTMRSVQKKEIKQPGIVKQDCSICCDMQVDSLLYRCGHMCTCFKCAVELQRTSGECPVCEAPIIDVVKAFAHEN